MHFFFVFPNKDQPGFHMRNICICIMVIHTIRALFNSSWSRTNIRFLAGYSLSSLNEAIDWICFYFWSGHHGSLCAYHCFGHKKLKPSFIVLQAHGAGKNWCQHPYFYKLVANISSRIVALHKPAHRCLVGQGLAILFTECATLRQVLFCKGHPFQYSET